MNGSLDETAALGGDRGTDRPRLTKRDFVVAELREMIARGDLARGSRVHQDWLATRLNTSITPVREALRLLEAEGLLVGESHRGVRVADANYDEIKTVYIQRMLLEPYAVRRAVRRFAPRDMDRAQAILEQMAGRHGDDGGRIGDLNRAFHFTLYDKAGNEGLRAQIEMLWRQFPWDILDVIDTRVSSAHREHKEILAAVADGDVDEAGAALERHLSASFQQLAMDLTGTDQPDPFELDND